MKLIKKLYCIEFLNKEEKTILKKTLDYLNPENDV